MINSTTNTSYNFRAIMNDVSIIGKPLLTVAAIVKAPDWLSYFFSLIGYENISDGAVLVSQVGGAIYILFKIYDWIHGKVTKKKEDEIK